MASHWILRCAVFIAVVCVVFAGTLLDEDKLFGDEDDNSYRGEDEKGKHLLKFGVKMTVLIGVVGGIAKMLLGEDDEEDNIE